MAVGASGGGLSGVVHRVQFVALGRGAESVGAAAIAETVARSDGAAAGAVDYGAAGVDDVERAAAVFGALDCRHRERGVALGGGWAFGCRAWGLAWFDHDGGLDGVGAGVRTVAVRT